MIVAGLTRPESTILRRNWPSDHLAPGSLQIGRKIALKPLFRERPAVAQQAQPDLPVHDDCAAAHGVPPAAPVSETGIASPTTAGAVCACARNPEPTPAMAKSTAASTVGELFRAARLPPPLSDGLD